MIPKDRKIYGRFIGQPISAKDLLNNLPVKNKRQLRTIRRQIKVREGQAITDRLDFSESVYILQRGKAELSFTNRLNHRVYRRELQSSEIIGLRRLISSGPQHKMVKTLSTCDFDIFPAEEFLELLSGDSFLAYRLLELLCIDIDKSYREFTETVF